MRICGRFVLMLDLLGHIDSGWIRGEYEWLEIRISEYSFISVLIRISEYSLATLFGGDTPVPPLNVMRLALQCMPEYWITGSFETTCTTTHKTTLNEWYSAHREKNFSVMVPHTRWTEDVDWSDVRVCCVSRLFSSSGFVGATEYVPSKDWSCRE